MTRSRDRLSVRSTEAQLQAYEAAAEAAGLSLAQWVHATLGAAAGVEAPPDGRRVYWAGFRTRARPVVRELDEATLRAVVDDTEGARVALLGRLGEPGGPQWRSQLAAVARAELVARGVLEPLPEEA